MKILKMLVGALLLNGAVLAREPGPDDAAVRALELSSYSATTISELLSVVADAEKAKDRFKDPVQRIEILKIEALALGRAFSLGNQPSEKDLAALVARLRKDARLSEEDRWKVCSLLDLTIASRGDNADIAIRKKIASTSIELAKEFPEAPSAFVFVLGMAQTEPDSDLAKQLVGFLLKSEKTPAYVRSTTEVLSARLSLLGKRLWTVVPNGDGFIPHRLELPDGKSVVFGAAENGTMPRILIYSWSVSNSYTQDAARKLKKFQDAGYTVIGVCVSSESEEVRKLGALLPGTQIYDPAGPDGRVATALHFDETFNVTSADRSGLVDSVTLGLQVDKANPNTL